MRLFLPGNLIGARVTDLGKASADDTCKPGMRCGNGGSADLHLPPLAPIFGQVADKWVLRLSDHAWRVSMLVWPGLWAL